MKHVDNMAKIILLTGTIVGYAYLMELFIAWYSRQQVRSATPSCCAIAYGPYGWAYYAMMFCNVISPQIFWFKMGRENLLGRHDRLPCS